MHSSSRNQRKTAGQSAEYLGIKVKKLGRQGIGIRHNQLRVAKRIRGKPLDREAIGIITARLGVNPSAYVPVHQSFPHVIPNAPLSLVNSCDTSTPLIDEEHPASHETFKRDVGVNKLSTPTVEPVSTPTL